MRTSTAQTLNHIKNLISQKYCIGPKRDTRFLKNVCVSYASGINLTSPLSFNLTLMRVIPLCEARLKIIKLRSTISLIPYGYGYRRIRKYRFEINHIT